MENRKTKFWLRYVQRNLGNGGASKEEIKALLAEHQPWFLVWNRDVAAVIAIQRLRELGIKVAVLANDEDVRANTYFTTIADRVVNVGELSYVQFEEIFKLIPDDIVAILPMWGFSAEIPGMEASCKKRGIIWVGQSDEVLTKLGDKAAARKIAVDAGVPVSPGVTTPLQNLDEAVRAANEVGYPVRLKAAFGGGGRGQEVVGSDEDLMAGFQSLGEYAKKQFGNPDLILEKEIVSPQHGEVQIIADGFGKVVGVDYRICSVQVRQKGKGGQKKLEWGHHPWIENRPEIKMTLINNAEKVCRQAGLTGICTVEFLIYSDTNGQIKVVFMEVNTRIQVEHRATEILTGLNLIEWMVIVSFGGRIDFDRSDLAGRKEFSVNVRCVAFDPKNNFNSKGGYVMSHRAPSQSADTWVVSSIRTGHTCEVDFDPMFAMVTVRADTWKGLHQKAAEILSSYKILGFPSSIPLDIEILRNRQITEGEPVSVDFLSENLEELLTYRDRDAEALRIARYIMETSAKGYSPIIGTKHRGFDSPYLVPSMVPPAVIDSHRDYPDLKDNGSVEFIDYIRRNAAAGRISYEITMRDVVQCETTNFLSMWLINKIGPLLDQTNVAMVETWGGATPQQAARIMGCPPFEYARIWKGVVKRIPLVMLSRSTNIVGLNPQPRQVIPDMVDMIVQSGNDCIRNFDSVDPRTLDSTHEAYARHREKIIYMPCLTMTRPDGKRFTISGYLEVVRQIINDVADKFGMTEEEVINWIILDLKDMSGNWMASEITELVTGIVKMYPRIVMRYHTHQTSGMWAMVCLAAVKAGVQMLCLGLESMTRNFGQPPIQTVDAILREQGYEPIVNMEAVSALNDYLQGWFALYDAYLSPRIKGPKYSVRDTKLAGGAMSSISTNLEEMGIAHLKQFVDAHLQRSNLILGGHAVTPMQQLYITQAASAVCNEYNRVKDEELSRLRRLKTMLENMDLIIDGQSERVSVAAKARIFAPLDSLKQFLLGCWGTPPGGYPDDWVYQATFGEKWGDAIAKRSDLAFEPAYVSEEEIVMQLEAHEVEPSLENILSYRLFPRDFPGCMENIRQYGMPFLTLPDHVSLQGLIVDGCDSVEFQVGGEDHSFRLLTVSSVNPADGTRTVEGMLNSYLLKLKVVVRDVRKIEKADQEDPLQISYGIPGKIYKCLKKTGDSVAPGDTLVVLEIAKNEVPVCYQGTESAKVKRIVRPVGEKVGEGDLLVELEKL
ncbi:MAG: biotin carboxylase N-terminal domain-containing protein [Patescibacteria group bacterium]